MPILTRVGAAAFLFALLAVPGSAQGVDVTGRWVFQVETGQGSGTPTLTFKQAGETLTGSYEGQLGSAELTGTVKGNTVHFTFNVNAQGTDIDVVYDGTVDGPSMQGTVSMAGGQLSGTFTAKKQ
jgi:hypothetical protein